VARLWKSSINYTSLVFIKAETVSVRYKGALRLVNKQMFLNIYIKKILFTKVIIEVTKVINQVPWKIAYYSEQAMMK